MNQFSWDQRIRRAEQLAAEHAEAAEMLRFYAQVAHFQKGVYERLKAQGASASPPECLEPEFADLLRLIQHIGPPAMAARARELETQRRTFAEITAEDAPEDLVFFARVLLQPYMECLLNGSRAAAQGSASRCPACGERPQAAVLRGEGDGAKRSLLCSLCGNEWEFRRILCPNCGEEDHRRLPVYSAAGFAHVRIEACDRCHTYLKAIDLSKNGLAVPHVDELATVALNLWAEQSGYHALQPNLFGL
jgi:FdhE protein